MSHHLAQEIVIGPTGTGTPVTIVGPLQGIDKLTDLLNVIINVVLFPLAGVIVFFILIWGGYDLMMSQGEAEKIQSGRNKITTAIIGMVLLTISYLITKIIGYVFGLGGGVFGPIF
ncbi:hypothetical protein A3A93_02955 [Candidatus Roizmanbacteria bacterium RIFCSPLOWO2_01_FULL_38_12]|uniref:Uncharacterized protein n=1 Tax=Candidatus Roizmanbacteria bacterium RIFCSPLOWO2_01_FULL_38_12 TaxID=1802061 RepID=A0A1F7IWB3_9BACT|nr:MAG: hypothetical protein A3F59_05290 [Candidatus Roizmanbacteria bacterium RIFCSPHIGHO2_12_FULL_38_13]OGK47624.1 MAG: hypothetical protein A3A93_02955 [Candidatus Roizmanbacteria bacterium RIFCSPLOWO2_01_FULL_38_12]